MGEGARLTPMPSRQSAGVKVGPWDAWRLACGSLGAPPITSSVTPLVQSGARLPCPRPSPTFPHACQFLTPHASPLPPVPRCEAALSEAIPILNSAIAALDTIKPADIKLVQVQAGGAGRFWGMPWGLKLVT